jgi:SulP family sulfate permease
VNAYGLRLRSVPFFSAVKEYCIDRPYNMTCARSDLLAGITVALTGVPLAMALALAAGLPPEMGLYGALIAGFVAALVGGSALTVTAPTTAFVVVIYPIMQKYGMSGVLTTGFLTGIILLAMGAARLGRLINFMPEAVTMGFSVGVAIVIVSLQLKDFLGIPIDNLPIVFTQRIEILIRHLVDCRWQEALIGIATLSVFLLARNNRLNVPHALLALLTGLMLSFLLRGLDVSVETVGERFSYINTNQNDFFGLLPGFIWPWKSSISSGATQWLSINSLGDISSAAFALAMLAAMEAMLTSLVLKDLTWKRSYPNGELLGMGLSNLLGAFLSAMPISAALSRSVANATAGGKTPVASMVNAFVVLLVLIFLAPLLAEFPVAMLAGLLVGVAWTLSALPKVVERLNKALWSDRLVFITGVLLTVFYDMVAAITAAVLLACVLFVKEIANATRSKNITHDKTYLPEGIATGWVAYRVCGPLFFAAADRVFADLEDETIPAKGVLICMDAVNMIDAGGLVAMERFITVLSKRQQRLLIADVQFQPLRMFAKAKLRPKKNVRFCASLVEALDEATHWDYLTNDLVLQKELPLSNS